MIGRPPRSPLFPYPTLFRSSELADQGRLDLPEPPLVQPTRQRLWIIAADRPLEISDCHDYVFVDSVLGAPLSENDLLLLRTSTGGFVLFAPIGGEAAARDIP